MNAIATLTAKDAAKAIGTSRTKLLKRMQQLKLIQRCQNGGGYLPTCYARHNNLVKTRLVGVGALQQRQHCQILITAEGMDYLQQHTGSEQ